MLHHIKTSDEIKRSLLVRQRFGGALLHPGEATSATKVQSFIRDINAFSHAEIGEHLQVGARATPYVENSGTALAQLAADAFDKSFNDPAPADKPPVLPLHLVHDGIGVFLHFARQVRTDVVDGAGQGLSADETAY